MHLLRGGRGRSPSLPRVGVVGTTMRRPETTLPMCSEGPHEPRPDGQNWTLRREGVGAGSMKWLGAEESDLSLLHLSA